MALLQSHLEQISQSAESLAELEFLPPRLFTNALLHNHEITSLIRDVETHERALFSIDPSAAHYASSQSTNRQPSGSGYDNAGTRQSLYAFQKPREQSAVARVLGQDMLREIQLSNGVSARTPGGKGVNIEVLLNGVEKLCAVYAVPGATEKVAYLRHRHSLISQSISHYDSRVSQQQTKLERMNKASEWGQDETQGEHPTNGGAEAVLTEEDLRAEEEEIHELERKKKDLEERVSGMERDLGGLLR